MLRDRFHLRRLLRKIDVNAPSSRKALEDLAQRTQRSSELVNQRRQRLPQPQLDPDLPIFSRHDEIAQAIRDHQVVVVSGETGSGKSTQLPLIAIGMGIGIHGLIGHTQPRRIAARSIANRIASQLDTPLGDDVGFKIRFDDKTKDSTYIKLMTDGILLAETQSDRFLDQYEMIIIDEAHERSLNIDFLIGNLKRLLAKRKNLKVVITSATIDTERFARHFESADGQPAPIIHVEGRTYPVEMRYSPIEEDSVSDDTIEHLVSTVQKMVVDEQGDILVFLPTEKDIKSVHKKLRGHLPNGNTIDVLPLYARLSTEQQNAIFKPGNRRRIVLATNVAESSITVPRIRIVVDSGTARVSRYAPRSKVQRLPIEAISQASANQRSGRCGRIGPGICVRLFSEDDFDSRPKFTTPEIRRTNLAAVILQTLALKLGNIAEFPFIDPPQPEAIRDGYKTLFEIGAIDQHRRLTSIGRWLAKIPVDPRIGRMIYAANEEGCLNEILIIAAALEIQDPRIRPAERQSQADEQHQKFQHEKSDFMSYLQLWDFFHRIRSENSRSQFRKACQHNFLSLTLIHQWQEIHRQLKATVLQSGLKVAKRKDDFAAIHRSLLTGLLSGVSMLGDKFEYSGAGGIKFHLWPGSGVFKSKPKWAVVSEIVETTRRYGRNVAKIAPEWIEPIASHLAKYSYSDPHWSKKQQTTMAYENVTLFGLPIVQKRRRHYAKIDPDLSRQLFIEHGLTEFQISQPFEFLQHNQDVTGEIEKSAAKSRERNWIVDNSTICRFYDERLPEDVVDVHSLQRAIKSDPQLKQRLQFDIDDLGLDASPVSQDLFPDSVSLAGMQLPVDYRFEPGHQHDGATLKVPREALSQINANQTGWLIPGLNQERIVAMIKSLPKSLRRHFVPAPETAKKVMSQMDASSGSLESAVANELSRIAGVPISPNDLDDEKIAPCLKLNIQVINETGEPIASGRNVNEIRKSVGVSGDSFIRLEDDTWTADNLESWTWNEIPDHVKITRGNTEVKFYPAIVDQGNCVGLRLVDTPENAKHLSLRGITRLFAIQNRKSLKKQVNWLPEFDRHAVMLTPYISSILLKEGLKDTIARMAVEEGNSRLPKNESEFVELNHRSVELISIGTQRIASWLPKFANSVQACQLAIENLPEKYRIANEDIQRQISSLVDDEFLLTTPWPWLQHFPRYFEAIQVRCERLVCGSMTSDQESVEVIDRYSQQFCDLSEAHAGLSIFDSELTKLRWMIEEFRVSKFAQKLGTSLTISETRLDKQLKKIRKL